MTRRIAKREIVFMMNLCFEKDKLEGRKKGRKEEKSDGDKKE